jgi:hypothetical protein
MDSRNFLCGGGLWIFSAILLIDIEKQLPIEYLMNNIVVSDQIFNC